MSRASISKLLDIVVEPEQCESPVLPSGAAASPGEHLLGALREWPWAHLGARTHGWRGLCVCQGG